MKRLSILIALLLAACGRGAPQPQEAATAHVAKAAEQLRMPGSALANPDFEQTAADGSVPGWAKTQHAGPVSYDMRIDHEGAYAGRGSFHMTRTQPQVYGSLTQTLDARAYAGKTIELSAMLKTKGVGPRGWRLFINADMPGTLVYSPVLKGDSDWTRESVRLNVPAKAHQLTVGVSLLDAGEGWMDNVELRPVD
jgi:hypothetical protein